MISFTLNWPFFFYLVQDTDQTNLLNHYTDPVNQIVSSVSLFNEIPYFFDLYFNTQQEIQGNVQEPGPLLLQINSFFS